MGRRHISFLITLILVNATTCAFGLQPEKILVIANQNASQSIELAKYYMKKRGVPADHLVRLKVTNKELCTRDEYDRKIVPKIREYLTKKDLGGRIRCLVTMYGVPLKVSPPSMSSEEARKVRELKQDLRTLNEHYKGIPEKSRERKMLQEEIDDLRKQIQILNKTNCHSSIDSELSLVKLEGYPLDGWIPNPYFVLFHRGRLAIEKGEVLMVSRLDGPSDKIVKRIIDDSIVAEKCGLRGKAYFDARWPMPKADKTKKINKGYAFYDMSIHHAAEEVKKSGILEVLINEKQELFQPGECPDAALYCGWYSLGHYLDAFDWSVGAVGYHIASAECTTLRRKGSQVWCKRMLEDGVSATIGPTSEPYVQGFPVPEIFFNLLMRGYYSLSECYYLSLPYLSWQMVLVGDPLYRPFAAYNE